MQKGELVKLETLHHAMNRHLKKYAGMTGRVEWVQDEKVYVTFPPTDFWKQRASFVISSRHLIPHATAPVTGETEHEEK